MTTLLAANVVQNAVLQEEFLPDGSVIWAAMDLVYDGCIAQGASQEEALAALNEAREQYADAAPELQMQTPDFVPVVRSPLLSRIKRARFQPNLAERARRLLQAPSSVQECGNSL